MRRLVVALALLAALWLGVEMAAPPFAESRIEEQVAERSRGAARVDAELASFPVVSRLLATERVTRLTVTLEEVTGMQVELALLRFELEGVELERSALLGGEVHVRHVDRGRLVAEISEETLAAALGVPVELRPDRVIVDPSGVAVEATVESARGRLRIVAGGLVEVDVPLPDEPFACTPEVTVVERRLVVSCTLEGVPTVLLRALSG